MKELIKKMLKAGFPLCYKTKTFPKGRHCKSCISHYKLINNLTRR
jgi:hypothetical protein